MKINSWLKKITVMIALIATINLFVGCYGSFTLTKKLYKWNGTVGNKFIQSGLMWVLLILPVYSATTFIDFVVLNTIEFWTDSNPLAMSESDKEIQIVKSEKSTYQITATKNQFEIMVIEGENIGKKATLKYNEIESSWYLNDGIKDIKIAEFDASNLANLKIFTQNGDVIYKSLDTSF